MSGTRRGLMLLVVLVAMMAGWVNTAAAQMATTTVQDTVYSANGTPAGGMVLVSWNAFTTVGGQSVPSGTTSATIGAGGVLTIALAPNAGSTPMGSYYTAVFHLSDGTTSREYWVIPVSVPGGGPATLAAIKNQVLPTSVAMQTVSKAYVDDAIAAAVTGVPLDTSPYVLKAGDTMTGPLVLPADPVNTNQAADKHYVDTSAAATAAGLGQKVSLLPTASQAVAQPSGTSFSIDGAYASTTFSGTGTSSQSVITSANTIASPTIGGYVQLTNTLNCFESGFDLGNNGTSAVGWSGCALDNDTEESATRGISQLHAGDFSHFAQGDTAAFYTYLTAFGGAVASSDEAVTHTVEHTNQIGYYSGVIATGGTTGSNLLTTNSFTCQGYCATLDNNQFADGGILLDMSKGASTATLASEGTALNGMYYTLASGTVTPSTAWGNIIPSTCTNNGNGFWQNYTSTTCNVTLGTSPASPGNFIAGQDIFLSGPFEEEAAVVTVGSPSGGVQSITFNTRYAWNSANGNTNAALVMQGGPGGQSIVAAGAVNSWPVAYPVVGATSPTQVFFSNCISGYCNGIVGSGNIIQLSSTNLFNAGATVTRTGNVVTLTAAVPGYRIYLLPIGASVVLSGFTPSDLNGTFTVTSNSEDANNFSVTWAQNGTNEASTAFGAVSQAPVAIAFYPSAFITGTNNGVAGNAQLATNTIPFATGDTVVGAPTSEFQNAGLNVYIGQNTPIDGSRASQGIMVNDGGPSQLARAYAALNKPANGVAGNMFYVNGSYADDFYFGYRPANNGSILFVQGNEPVSANAKAYNIFADNGSPGSAGTFSFNPLTGGFSLSGNLAASSIKATAAASAFAAGSTVGGILPCLQNGTNCPAGGSGGTGTLTSVAVGTWPSWLTPTVTNATTSPTIAVTASSIPNGALASSATTVNGQTCTLGSTCTVPIAFAQVTGTASAVQLPAATASTQGTVLLPTGAATNTLGAAAMLPGSIAINSSTCALGGTCTITAAPPSEIKYYPAAVCDGGTAYASGLTRYDNQQPQAGCVLPASSALGYLAFNAASTLPQYAEATVATPTYWTGTSLYIKFYSLAITGTATWYVQTACTNDGSVIGTSSFGTAVSIISTVSSISGVGVTTAVLSGIATPGTNGCTAGTTLPGSLLTYRIYRSATDTAAGNVNLLGITMVTGRSQ
jgi:hypothetical protein